MYFETNLRLMFGWEDLQTLINGSKRGGTDKKVVVRRSSIRYTIIMLDYNVEYKPEEMSTVYIFFTVMYVIDYCYVR